MSTSRNKMFDTLKAEWDKKLKESGFNDIERPNGTLKDEVDYNVLKNAMKEKEEREIYYSIAREFLITHQFEEAIERDIWELHCEGIGRLSIAKQLKTTPYKVESSIIKFRKLCGLRK